MAKILNIIMLLCVIIKKELTGIEPVTLGPAIPRSTTELQFHICYCSSLKGYVLLRLRILSVALQLY